MRDKCKPKGIAFFVRTAHSQNVICNFMTTEIRNRINNLPKNKILNVHTKLEHFSIITYLVEIQKLERHIPDEYKIFTVRIDSIEYGLVSAVTFVDKDFNFKNLFPFYKVNFPQTNYRCYIIDKKSGENCAWFFGTGIGSKLVSIPKNIWKMPWFYSDYETDFLLENGTYLDYKVKIKAENSNASIDIVQDVNSVFDKLDFNSLEEATLILTHPVTGYFKRSDNKIGRYKIWHPKMEISVGKANELYFEKFEKLNLLNKEQMQNPYSILMTKKIDFIIDLPPKSI